MARRGQARPATPVHSGKTVHRIALVDDTPPLLTTAFSCQKGLAHFRVRENRVLMPFHFRGRENKSGLGHAGDASQYDL
jgi:hypothetical protein